MMMQGGAYTSWIHTQISLYTHQKQERVKRILNTVVKPAMEKIERGERKNGRYVEEDLLPRKSGFSIANFPSIEFQDKLSDR